MMEQGFHITRVPLYLDIDTLNVKLAKGKYADMSQRMGRRNLFQKIRRNNDGCGR